MTIPAIIQKLEAAEEGSRELDGRIAWMLGWRFNGGVTPADEDFKLWPEFAGHWHKPGDKFADILNKAEYRSETNGFPSGRWDDPPNWTASLEAAIALVDGVKPGWAWGVNGFDPEGPVDIEGQQDFRQPYAMVSGPSFLVKGQDGEPDWWDRPAYDANAPTPALALCLALLKALQPSPHKGAEE